MLVEIKKETPPKKTLPLILPPRSIGKAAPSPCSPGLALASMCPPYSLRLLASGPFLRNIINSGGSMKSGAVVGISIGECSGRSIRLVLDDIELQGGIPSSWRRFALPSVFGKAKDRRLWEAQVSAFLLEILLRNSSSPAQASRAGTPRDQPPHFLPETRFGPNDRKKLPTNSARKPSQLATIGSNGQSRQAPSGSQTGPRAHIFRVPA